MGATAQQWGDRLLGLVPPSLRGLYSRTHQTLADFVDALGAELARFDARTDEALDEMFPGAATETIGAWEELLGLTPESGASLADRQAAVAGAFAARGGQSAAYFAAVALAMGVVVEITEPMDWPHWWQVLTAGGEWTRARCDGPCDAPLVEWTSLGSRVAELLTRYKPAHSRIWWTD